MALDAYLIGRMRRKIGDTTASSYYTNSSAYRYSDTILTGYILDAVGPIAKIMGSSHSANYAAETISPTASDDYREMFVLWAAISLIGGDTESRSTEGIRFREGDTEVDLSASLGDRRKMLEALQKQLDDLIEKVKLEEATGSNFDPEQLAEVAETWDEAAIGSLPDTSVDVDDVV